MFLGPFAYLHTLIPHRMFSVTPDERGNHRRRFRKNASNEAIRQEQKFFCYKFAKVTKT